MCLLPVRLLRSLLSQQPLGTLHLLCMGCDTLTHQLSAPTRSPPRLCFGAANQFLQATGRNRIARMMKATQPETFMRTSRETDARHLVAELHALIHPAEGRVGICRAGRADGLAHEVQVEDHGGARLHQLMHGRANEGLTESLKRLLHRADRFVITGSERAT